MEEFCGGDTNEIIYLFPMYWRKNEECYVVGYVTKHEYFIKQDDNVVTNRNTVDWAIEPQFEEANKFSEGLGAVKKYGRWGYTDKNGQAAIKCEYRCAGDFHHGYARVSKDLNRFYFINKINENTFNKTFGYIDEEGFDDDENVIVGDDKKYGILNDEGKITVPIMYDNLCKINLIGSLFDYSCDPKAAFGTSIYMACINGIYGVIDALGNEIVEFNYDNEHSASKALESLAKKQMPKKKEKSYN